MTHIEAIVQKQLDYYNANDLEGFVSTYHEDIEILNLEDQSLILKGLADLKEKYKERFHVQKVQAKLVNRMLIGDKVIDHESVSGIKENEDVKAVAVYQIEDELIRRVWFLFE